MVFFGILTWHCSCACTSSMCVVDEELCTGLDAFMALVEIMAQARGVPVIEDDVIRLS
jgi:hypothetical protein